MLIFLPFSLSKHIFVYLPLLISLCTLPLQAHDKKKYKNKQISATPDREQNHPKIQGSRDPFIPTHNIRLCRKRSPLNFHQEHGASEQRCLIEHPAAKKLINRIKRSQEAQAYAFIHKQVRTLFKTLTKKEINECIFFKKLHHPSFKSMNPILFKNLRTHHFALFRSVLTHLSLKQLGEIPFKSIETGKIRSIANPFTYYTFDKIKVLQTFNTKKNLYLLCIGYLFYTSLTTLTFSPHEKYLRKMKTLIPFLSLSNIKSLTRASFVRLQKLFAAPSFSFLNLFSSPQLAYLNIRDLLEALDQPPLKDALKALKKEVEHIPPLKTAEWYNILQKKNYETFENFKRAILEISDFFDIFPLTEEDLNKNMHKKEKILWEFIEKEAYFFIKYYSLKSKNKKEDFKQNLKNFLTEIQKIELKQRDKPKPSLSILQNNPREPLSSERAFSFIPSLIEEHKDSAFSLIEYMEQLTKKTDLEVKKFETLKETYCKTNPILYLVIAKLAGCTKEIIPFLDTHATLSESYRLELSLPSIGSLLEDAKKALEDFANEQTILRLLANRPLQGS